MSALGHYLEEEGIATVAVVLIRPQAENTKPPRALWVPFELGRPFGPPNDPTFQKRVVLTALGMLVEGGGPVRIIDFPDDDPRARPDPAWQPPFMPAAVVSSSAEFSHPGWRRKSCCSRRHIGVGWSNMAAARWG